MHLGTWIHTLLHGRMVGRDAYGNRYYMGRRANGEGRLPRWVVYKGIAEPTKVPPEWHGWLHYTHDALPETTRRKAHVWEKPAQPNLTGTDFAYRPPGHLLKGGVRSASSSDYEAWKP